ncbi:MAG: transcriptional regulator, family [Myxococcaceae bacterium]|nr:transcriptional regulator, family [Myxococcaceae bacterium]
MTRPTEAPPPDAPEAPSDLWPSEQLLSDAIGRLMEFWGFKRHMGRIWTVLYLSDEPLGATELRDKLQLSAGSVSMAMTDLLRWGVVKKLWVHGQRRDYFVAESNLWKMVSRVFRERELVEIHEAIAAMEGALTTLETKLTSKNPAVRARAETQVARIERLLELAKLGRRLIESLLDTARLDAVPLTKFLLGARRS